MLSGFDAEGLFVQERFAGLIKYALGVLGALGERPYSDSEPFLVRYTYLPSFEIPWTFRLSVEGEISLTFPSYEDNIVQTLSSGKESLPDSSLATLPDEWLQRDGELEYVHFRLLADDFSGFRAALNSYESRFSDNFDMGPFDRMDGAGHFVELGGIQKYLFVYNENTHADLMKLLYGFIERNLWFMAPIASEIYACNATPLAVRDADEISELLNAVDFSPEQIALLFRQIPLLALRRAIERLPLSREIFFLSEKLKSGFPDWDEYRALERRLCRPIYAAENERAEKHRKAKLREHNLKLEDVLTDLDRSVLRCPRCDNGRDFRVKQASDERKGYVFCQECGLSIYSREQYGEL